MVSRYKAVFLDRDGVLVKSQIKNRKAYAPKTFKDFKIYKDSSRCIKKLSSKGYKTVDKSFYFFSWNKDKLKIYKKIINIYKPLKILNGLQNNEITKNKPRDGIIERLHIINYPLNSGQISRHYDPVNVSIFNFGLYATEYGKDYTDGGFFVLNKNNKKIVVDRKIKKTDIVLFFPSLIHGVDKVKNSKIEKSNGRWFININHIQSHEIKNRQYTRKY